MSAPLLTSLRKGEHAAIDVVGDRRPQDSQNHRAHGAATEGRLQAVDWRQTIVFGSAYCAEQHSVARKTCVERGARQRRTELANCDSTNCLFVKLKCVSAECQRSFARPEPLRQLLQVQSRRQEEL